FARNEDYWRNDLPYLDRLILRFLRDPASRAAAMETGEIQLGVGNPTTHPEVKRLAASGKLVMTTKGYSENAWSATLECNTRNPILAKREVRQAIFHALDREWIGRTVYYGFARPGTGPIYSTNAEFNEKAPTRGRAAAAGRVRLDHARQPRGAQPFQPPQLRRLELGRSLAGLNLARLKWSPALRWGTERRGGRFVFSGGGRLNDEPERKPKEKAAHSITMA